MTILRQTLFAIALAIGSFGAAQALTAAPPEGVESWVIYRMPCSLGDVPLGKSFCISEASIHGGPLPTPNPPVVTTAALATYTPTVNTQAIGTVAATNSPTSWTINSCSGCTNYFAINASGNLTVTTTGAAAITNAVLPQVTFSPVVQASNASGNGTGTVTITFWPDGSGAAPAGTAQFPSLFTSPINYSVRPAWKVAGVDYKVGTATGQTFHTCVGTLVSGSPGCDAALPCGGVFSGGNLVTITSQNGCTVDGWKFDHVALWFVGAGTANVTIQNSYLSYYGTCITDTATCSGSNSHTNMTVTVTKTEFDGNGLAGNLNNTGLFNYYASGTVTMTYAYFHDVPCDAVEMFSFVDAKAFIGRFNLFTSLNFKPSTLHSDTVQISNGMIGLTQEFSTLYQPPITGQDSLGNNVPGIANSFPFVTDLGAQNAINVVIRNNTALGDHTSNHGDQGCSGCVNNSPALNRIFFLQPKNIVSTDTGNIVSPVVTGNYADPLAARGVWPNDPCTPAGFTKTGGHFTSGSAVVTGLANTTSLVANMSVINASPPVPASTKILSNDSASQITMTASANGNATVSLVTGCNGTVTGKNFTGNINPNTGAVLVPPY